MQAGSAPSGDKAAAGGAVGFDAIERAHEAISPWIHRTPVDRSPWLAAETGAEVWLKLENLQHTGSFKVRGALNAVLETARARQIITASSGNHAAAVAWALSRYMLKPIVLVPSAVTEAKIQRLRHLRVEVEIYGDDAAEAEGEARRRAAANGWHYISPYNDPTVIAGQGTVAAEFAHQAGPLDAVFVAVGGGGLIGGMAVWLKTQSPSTKIIGCSPNQSPAMARAVALGRIHDVPCGPTLSDATAGGIEPDSLTFPLCRDLVDEWVDVTEGEIAAAVRGVIEHHHMLVEGSAGVAVAGAMKTAKRFSGLKIGIVLCGASISLGSLKAIL